MKIVKWILRIIGALLMLDAFVLSLVSNYNLGLLILFLLGAGLLIWGIFLERINQGKHRKIAIWLQGLAIAGLAAALGISLFLLIYGSVNTADETEDAVIVLGAGIRGDQVTLTLQYRLDACLDYIEQNPEALIVVSGGQGPQETTTEAKAMEQYLIRKGVDPNKIIKEERASSTIENFQFSKQLLDERLKKPYTIVLVTNDFHIYRAHQYAKMAGFQDPRQLRPFGMVFGTCDVCAGSSGSFEVLDFGLGDRNGRNQKDHG